VGSDPCVNWLKQDHEKDFAPGMFVPFACLLFYT